MNKKILLAVFWGFLISACLGQSPVDENKEEEKKDPAEENPVSPEEFVMGVDLSYVNQILDYGGTYKVDGTQENPYKIFNDYGADVVRLRLWHDPEWTAELYEGSDNQMYNDLADVVESIRQAKKQNMAVNLDFHYSDTWADPSTQDIPEAWIQITDLEVLKDSVYNYTKQTLQHLNNQGLMPEYVQIGNETNSGFMYTNAPADFPKLNVADGNWENAGEVFNSGIQAVREVATNSNVDTKIILHIAQPENVEWWFEGMTTSGGVTDFDIVGVSYYTAWSDVSLNQISDHVSNFQESFGKDVMIVETAYPWTLENADSYTNIFSENSLLDGYPATKEGQRDFMISLTQEVIDGGGTGIMYWEPAWITSDMKDKWGTGSSWENSTVFDFEGNVHLGIDYMSHKYEF